MSPTSHAVKRAVESSRVKYAPTADPVMPHWLNARSGSSVDVLMFGEAPGVEEWRAGEAFVGPSWERVLKPWLMGVFPRLRVCLDNVCPEPIKGGRGKPSKEQLKYYAEYRAKRIAETNPKVVVLLGQFAMSAFKVKGKPLTKCGHLFSRDGRMWVVGVHPSWVLRNGVEGVPYLERIEKSIRAGMSTTSWKFTRLDDPGTIEEFLNRNAQELCVVDLETSALRHWDGRILCAAITVVRTKETVAFPVLWDTQHWSPRVLSLFKRWWPLGHRIAHNAKFEMSWLADTRYAQPTKVYDTMLLSSLEDSERPRGLDHLVVHVLHVKPYWERISFKDMAANDLDDLLAYCAMDTIQTGRLFKHFQKVLDTAEWQAYENVIEPLLNVTLSMEQAGIWFDEKRHAKLLTGAEWRIKRTARAIEKKYPGLNTRSPAQLQALLFDRMGLTPVGETDKGNPSTDKEALAKLAETNPEVKVLAEHKALLHLRDVLNGLRDGVREHAVRTNLTIMGARTGRYSSSSPNLQNLERNGEERSVLISRFKGGCLGQWDYSQHELRTYASLAGDEVFLNLYAEDILKRQQGVEGVDVHAATAEDITRKGFTCDRSRAKNVNFSVIYDISAKGLNEKYGIAIPEAKKLIEGWLKVHPWLVQAHERWTAQAKKLGYVENIFGVRRRIENPDHWHQRRQAINHPVQSTAVFISYRAMKEIHDRLQGFRSALILQVHDSVVCDVHPAEKERVNEIVVSSMVSDAYLKVLPKKLKHPIPLAVDAKFSEHF